MYGHPPAEDTTFLPYLETAKERIFKIAVLLNSGTLQIDTIDYQLLYFWEKTSCLRGLQIEPVVWWY